MQTSGTPGAPSNTRWLQLCLATLLLFLSGSFLALSVFSVPVEQAAPSPGTLENVWPSAMSVMSLVSVPFMMMAGIFLSNGKESDHLHQLPFGESKTDRLRIFSVFATGCVCALFLAGPAIQRGLSPVIFALVAIQAFLLALEMLAAWMPESPGLAVGCGQVAFGFGSMFFAEFFAIVIDKFDCVTGLNISVAVLSGVMLVTSLFIAWPPKTLSSYDNADAEPLARPQKRAIAFQQLPRIFSFWLYVFCILTALLGFAFVAYYFKIGGLFGQSMPVIVKAYDVMFFTATVIRPLLGYLADNLKWGEGLFSIASRNVMAVVLLIQAFAFLALIPISKSGWFAGYVVMSSLIFVAFAGGECVAPVLARDIFGAENSSLVFGIGGGIGFGLGEFLGVQLMSRMVSKSRFGNSPSVHNSFYFLGFVLGLVGVTSSFLLKPGGFAINCSSSSYMAVRDMDESDAVAECNTMTSVRDEGVTLYGTKP